MTALSVEVRRVGEQETPVDTTPVLDPELPPETETDAETESNPNRNLTQKLPRPPETK